MTDEKKAPVASGEGGHGGSHQGVFGPSSPPTSVRQRALELAVRTMGYARPGSFSDHQIVRTAHLYERYLTTGAVPPAPAPTEGEPDADVRG